MKQLFRPLLRAQLALAALAIALAAAPAGAHCDALDGPVVAAAREALRTGSVEPALAWIPAEDEPELRALFARVVEVRTLGEPARELADRQLFETLVRLHRRGEGYPYTGLQPAGGPVAPAVRAVDAALDHGSIDALLGELEEALAGGLRARFARAVEDRAHARESVEAGRRAVASYVELAHFAERLEQLLAEGPAHGVESGTRPHDADHH